jgi:hypothetical protein
VQGIRARAGGLLAVFLVALAMPAPEARAKEDDERTSFLVKHVYAGAVYLDGGRSAGLSEGQKLTVMRGAPGAARMEETFVAEIEIEIVASASAVGKVLTASLETAPGDVAYLSAEDEEKLRNQRYAAEIGKYAQVIGFTDGDPLDRERREELPRPPLPEVNRFRGRVALDFSSLRMSGGGIGTAQFGYMLRLDATRLGGSYWRVSGYHRGRFQSQLRGAGQDTLNDLINRTYHLSLSYDRPGSPWVAGAGRLYVPWAASLNTIDGFYVGRRRGSATVGVFAGTTPDPTSWNYNPDRQMAGVFANLERGSFESFRFSTTSGVALSGIGWGTNRQFGFFENALFYKRYVSVYSNVEADLLRLTPDAGSRSVVLSRNYVTLRIQPHRIVSFDINDNYFRNIPTFDARLIGTGLLDRFLFQGVSGGFRLALPARFGVYANAGRSSRTGDRKAAWNHLLGVTAGDIAGTGIRADVRYSRFDSSFGRGSYQALTANRDLGGALRFELQAGQQKLHSTLSAESRSRFVGGNLDWFLGPRYFLGFGTMVYRGRVQSYNQFFLTLGYRFDNRGSSKE